MNVENSVHHGRTSSQTCLGRHADRPVPIVQGVSLPKACGGLPVRLRLFVSSRHHVQPFASLNRQTSPFLSSRKDPSPFPLQRQEAWEGISRKKFAGPSPFAGIPDAGRQGLFRGAAYPLPVLRHAAADGEGCTSRGARHRPGCGSSVGPVRIVAWISGASAGPTDCSGVRAQGDGGRFAATPLPSDSCRAYVAAGRAA